MKKRIRVGVIFGGRSSEHEVSLVSATAVMQALDKSKYEVVPIGITKEGTWLSSAKALSILKSGPAGGSIEEQILLPDPRSRGLVRIDQSLPAKPLRPLDVIIPVLHGPYGEDGTVQGLLELADIPYVGAGVLASAVGMDKVIQKQLFRQAGLPTVRDLWFLWPHYLSAGHSLLAQVERQIGYPCFVKPANSGSSVGINKALNRKQLEKCIRIAQRYDRKILIEQAVQNAREIEVSVLGNENPEASVPGEIIPCNEFYDYDAKYVDGASQTIIPAPLPARVAQRIRKMAIEAYRAIDCSGMARVDFLVVRGTNKIYLSEINTIPGFTSISMYPKLWEASGLSYPRLLDKLIQLAIKRHKTRSRLKTSYHPKETWFR